MLPNVRNLFETSTKPLHRLRLRWAEGAIAAGLGDEAVAEQIYRAVQQEFLRLGVAYDAALVSLDLAVLFSRQGRNEDLRQLSAEILPVFEARDVHREALATLLLFRRAVEEERLTAEVAQQLIAALRRSRPARM
jgi:hypothetical protein